MSEEQASKDVKSEDKKDIEVEERERMLNEENKNQDKVKEVENEAVKVDIKEGMEVKPKKIPIGGIQMPGFFTRSKSKEKCKVCFSIFLNYIYFTKLFETDRRVNLTNKTKSN